MPAGHGFACMERRRGCTGMHLPGRVPGTSGSEHLVARRQQNGPREESLPCAPSFSQIWFSKCDAWKVSSHVGHAAVFLSRAQPCRARLLAVTDMLHFGQVRYICPYSSGPDPETRLGAAWPCAVWPASDPGVCFLICPYSRGVSTVPVGRCAATSDAEILRTTLPSVDADLPASEFLYAFISSSAFVLFFLYNVSYLPSRPSQSASSHRR